MISTTCNLIANFEATSDSANGHNNLYLFYNTSTSLGATDSIFWDFGDSTPIEFNQSDPVIHSYNTPGTYVVCLVVKKAISGSTNILCERQACKTIVVSEPTIACNDLYIDYTWWPDNANRFKINFHNFGYTFIPNTVATWSFGDGTTSNSWDTTHIYDQPGTYLVCLNIRFGNGCVKDTCKTVTICAQPLADFSWIADSNNNNRILFTNQSSPLSANTYVAWGFGDGDSSRTYNPDHVYAQPGTYLVCLRIGILGTPCVRDTCKTIVVLPSTVDSCNLQPSFVRHADSLNNRTIDFTNTTTGVSAATYAEWTFGDGTANAGWNISHTYAVPGWYLVCLTTVTPNGCTGTYCDSVFVPGNVIPPYNCDSFQLQVGYRRDENLPNKFFFYATGNAPVYNQQWSFIKLGPDSATVFINQNTPVYVFPDTGLYRICVRGAFSTNCVNESCTDIRITSTTAFAPRFVRSYPNPAHNNVSFNLQLSQPGLISITILSLSNMEVLRYTQQGATGNNLVTLNVRKLTPGFYVARIHYPDGVTRTRFVKF